MPKTVKTPPPPESETDVPTATPQTVTFRPKRRHPSYEDVKEEMQLFKAEMRELLANISNDVAEVKAQNTSIQRNFTDIQTSNEEIKKSIKFISQQYDDMIIKIGLIEKIKNEQTDKIQMLEDRIEELDRISCLSKLEIRNLPPRERETKEDLLKAVSSITNTINLNIDQKIVRDIYRMSNKNKPNSTVVVDVTSPIMKTNILQAVKEYNNKHKPSRLNASCVDNTFEPKPLYVAEYLTFKTKKLFYHTREFANSENYMFAWTANGKIYLRKKEGDPHTIIRSEKQLESLRENK